MLEFMFGFVWAVFLVLFVVLCGLILCEGGMFSVDFST